MKKVTRRCLLFASGIVCVLGGMAFYLGVPQSIYVAKTTSFPTGWDTIQPGMTSGEAREILGAPTADGRDLKSLDRWYLKKNGVLMHLDLWFYVGNQDDESEVGRVVRWKWAEGMKIDELANPPF